VAEEPVKGLLFCGLWRFGQPGTGLALKVAKLNWHDGCRHRAAVFTVQSHGRRPVKSREKQSGPRRRVTAGGIMMGIFTRVRDIINSNISAMLDKAEDPEKMVKLMIREMEDTLVEIKANCAAAMAAQKKARREMETMLGHSKTWDSKAALAVDRGREDLAREALLEKRRYVERAEALEQEFEGAGDLVRQYQDDIMQLEDKLNAAREKKRILVQRHRHAQDHKRTQNGIRRYDSSGAAARFEAFEQRIDRMEAEADLVNYGRKPTIGEEFANLQRDEELENELAALKARRQQQDTPPQT
jgi:phage shock protein A